MLSISPNGPHVLECLACACRVPATIAVMLFAPSSVFLDATATRHGRRAAISW
jgi:hypothetical protein